jgi:cytochrome oxidase Cu insertion factor (SCO1/SenC/PrrC family)
MRLSPRAKLLLVAALFALPLVASYVAYRFADGKPTANYGELLLPPRQIPAHEFMAASQPWRFDALRGRWVLAMSDSGACPDRCVEKLTALRQVQLALGRNGARVARVYVVDDLVPPAAARLEPFAGTIIAVTPRGLHLPPGAANDRAHLYLVDPNGNVMMRWPAAPDLKRMVKDLERLLKASQIG